MVIIIILLITLIFFLGRNENNGDGESIFCEIIDILFLSWLLDE